MPFSFRQLPDFSSFKTEFRCNSDESFTIVSVNIRSMRKYWEEFKFLAESAAGFVDVFVLTEINVSQACLNTFTLQGFSAHFVTRSGRRGGGIALFVNDNCEAFSVDVSIVHAESMMVKVCKRSFSVHILSVYRPPSCSLSRFLVELDETLRQWSSVDQFCLIGDFNINILCPEKVSVCDYLST